MGATKKDFKRLGFCILDQERALEKQVFDRGFEAEINLEVNRCLEWKCVADFDDGAVWYASFNSENSGILQIQVIVQKLSLVAL